MLISPSKHPHRLTQKNLRPNIVAPHGPVKLHIKLTLIRALPAHQNPGVSEEILEVKNESSMVRQSELPETVSFPKPYSGCKGNLEQQEPVQWGSFLSPVNEPNPHPYLPVHLEIQEEPSIQRSLLEHSSTFLLSLVSVPFLSSLPSPTPCTFLSKTSYNSCVLSKANCFLDILQAKASFPT